MTNANWNTAVTNQNGVPMQGDEFGEVWYNVPGRPGMRWCGKAGHQFTAVLIDGVGWDIAHHDYASVGEFQRVFGAKEHHEPLRYFTVPEGVPSILPFIRESMRLVRG